MYVQQRKLSAGEWQKLKNASQVISKQFRTKNSATEDPNISWYILDGDLLVSIAMLQFDLNTRKKFKKCVKTKLTDMARVFLGGNEKENQVNVFLTGCWLQALPYFSST